MPGEFSARAFINNKIDLIQAEAIADLIDSGSQSAARLASRSLQGVFSNKINALISSVIKLRVYLESSFDFTEEEIDYFPKDELHQELIKLLDNHQKIMNAANFGAVMREGLTLVIAGKVNAGKSSLLNQLTGRASAIVTEIPGTTRDLLKEYMDLDGIPLHIIDTAGLRETDDPVEVLGIERAKSAIESADHILWLIDDSVKDNDEFIAEIPNDIPYTIVRNKIDLSNRPSGIRNSDGYFEVSISALTGIGIMDLKKHIKQCAGIPENQEGEYIARQRHLDALKKAKESLVRARKEFDLGLGTEFIAEELRLAQSYLSEITGEFTSDDLLGEIFSTFCIGK